MVNMEKITINVPVGMSKYINVSNKENELIRNALLLDEAKGGAISNGNYRYNYGGFSRK